MIVLRLVFVFDDDSKGSMGSWEPIDFDDRIQRSQNPSELIPIDLDQVPRLYFNLTKQDNLGVIFWIFLFYEIQ